MTKRFFITPLLWGLIAGGFMASCSAISEEGYYPSADGVLYINEIPPVSVSATAGATSEITVRSNVAWTVSADQSWITLSYPDGTPSDRLSGKGTQTFTVTFAANTEANERTVTLTVTPETAAPEGDSELGPVSVKLTQNSPNFSVSPTQITVEAFDAKAQTVAIVANNPWKAVSSADWIHTSAASGDATTDTEALLTLTFDNNITNSERTGSVTITSGEQREIISILQQKGDFTLSRNEIAFNEQGGTVSVTVNAVRSWSSFVADAPWLELTPASGSASAEITVTAQTNLTGFTRTATVTFTAGDITVPLTVTQIPDGLTVTPKILNLNAGRQSLDLDVACSGRWTVDNVLTASWCRVVNTSGNADGKIALDIEQNLSEERATQFVVSFGESADTIVVHQARAIRPVVGPVNVIAAGSNSVEVTVDVASDSRVLECGYIWSEGEKDPAQDPMHKTIPCDIAGGVMHTVIGGLDEQKTYIIKAYVKTDLYTVYGDPALFNTKGLIPNEEDHPLPGIK